MEPASSADNMVVTEVDYEELEIEDDGLVAIIDPADRDKVNQPCCVRPCDQNCDQDHPVMLSATF